ncbi:MAG: ABC transporter ATP-binding protein [Verrucomicrobia bacterium]|nr:ABC transporter ATP-binding protein [Verrucomicrobiota bacterium]MDA1078918.1 ABC transporter ATP-binding protein [Verrucomicrobiota bacterium]
MIQSDPILQVQGLTKKFQSKLAVDSLTFSLPRGSIVGLLGGNGAGKTTTLSMLLGLLEPTSGKIQLFGNNFVRNRHSVLHRMNFCSPYVDLPQRLTVMENLRVFARLYGVRDSAKTIARLVDDFRLLELKDQPIRRLSSGQKTRVSLAKALINSPDFLLLDEPTASLSPDVSKWIRQQLADYRERTGATILFASHDMREVELLCDQVMMMCQGQLIEQGSPKELMETHHRSSLEEVFLALNEQGGVG